MKHAILIVSLVVGCQAGAVELVSPDGQYQIEYFESLPHEENVKFKNVKTGKVLGYTISYGYSPNYFLETAWSPDSRYLAVISRGTRTTADISVFSFVGGTVEEVSLPDYRLNLLGRKGLVTGGYFHWASNLRWDKNTITFHCNGEWEVGSGDPTVNPENWYDFDVSLRLGGLGSAPQSRLVSVEKAQPKKKSGQSDADKSATTAEDKGVHAEETPGSEKDLESKRSFIKPADKRLADLWKQIDPKKRSNIEAHLLEQGITAGLGSQILLSGLYENHKGLKDGTSETVAVFAQEEGIVQKRILWICVVNVTRMDSQLIYQFGDELQGGRKVVK